MPADWAVEEMRTANLKDKRLNARLTEVLSQLSQAPTASIPAACGGRAEMTAAYRFFDNEKASFEDVVRPHGDASLRRVAAQPVAILVQDTTEVDLTRPQQPVAGAGPLDGSRVGALLHVLHAFTPDGTPLGTVSAKAWTRDAAKAPCSSKSRSEQIRTPIEQKESHRWVTTLREAQTVAEACPSTHTICVADSEADAYEVLAEAATAASGLDWIVRGGYDRALQKGSCHSSASHLRELALGSPVLFQSEIHVRGRKPKIAQQTRRRRQPRESRDAEVAVRAVHAELRPPWRTDRRLPSVNVNVVMVQELAPPPGEEPVEWLLLTSLPIDCADQVREIVGHYATRWMIEIFFRVLKSGCRIEERRFEAIDRLLSCLAVYLIVAWRTLYACRLGRGCPEASCEVVFEPAEWKATWRIVRGAPPPRRAPKLGAMLPMVAALGGYVPRPKSPPGPQTVWIGLRRVHDFALCWETFGPEWRKKKHV